MQYEWLLGMVLVAATIFVSTWLFLAIMEALVLQ